MYHCCGCGCWILAVWWVGGHGGREGRAGGGAADEKLQKELAELMDMTLTTIPKEDVARMRTDVFTPSTFRISNADQVGGRPRSSPPARGACLWACWTILNEGMRFQMPTLHCRLSHALGSAFSEMR